MNVASGLAVSAVVVAQCGVYFLGLLRGQTDPASTRRGFACLAFSFYLALHAARAASVDDLRGVLGSAASAASVLVLVPAFVAIAGGQDPAPWTLRRASWLYALVGTIGVALHSAGLRMVTLDVAVRLPAPFLPRTGHELVGLAFLALGFVLGTLAVQRLARSSSKRAGTGIVVGVMSLALIAGAHDLALRTTDLRGLPIALDVSLVALALSCLFGTIQATTQAGDALQTKTDELAKSYAELRSTQERLVRNEQLAAVGELSAVVAHEVRNPLAIIKNALSGLRRKSLRIEDRGTLLDILDEETDKLNRLMHDLLAYARPVAPRLETVDIRKVFERSVERAFGGVRAPLGLDVRIDPGDVKHVLEGDPDLLVHAFVNVIENALQAMPQGGCLSIRAVEAVDRGRSCVGVEISDTGEGMDTIVREKARDPFFTTRPTGTGLGLAIVERVIRNHGGRIEIESRHGEGTTVRILLPLDRRSLEPLPIPESSSDILVLPKGRLP